MLPHDGIFVGTACFIAFLSGYLKRHGNDNVSILLNVIGVCFCFIYRHPVISLPIYCYVYWLSKGSKKDASDNKRSSQRKGPIGGFGKPTISNMIGSRKK